MSNGLHIELHVTSQARNRRHQCLKNVVRQSFNRWTHNAFILIARQTIWLASTCTYHAATLSITTCRSIVMSPVSAVKLNLRSTLHRFPEGTETGAPHQKPISCNPGVKQQIIHCIFDVSHRLWSRAANGYVSYECGNQQIKRYSHLRLPWPIGLGTTYMYAVCFAVSE